MNSILWLNSITGSGIVYPLIFTAKVAAVTCVLHLLIGVTLGYYLSEKTSRMRDIIDILVTLPLVFPPIALGFVLLLILGKGGPIGRFLYEFLGVQIIFSFWGVVLAAFVAGLPLIVKPVQSAIQSTAKSLVEASYVLGKSEWQTFFHVIIPSIKKSIVGGLTLAFGRSIGEVGLTLMLGGNIVGKTNTLSLEIYNSVFSGEFERALVLTFILGSISSIIFIILKKLATL
ncbi:MAG: molybdate ABC transporter permease subunit [Deltaproteobacteria bacterium]|nr:molybdate ABC transporter permease subunit [Deltaproteobacteria bacterium]